MKSKYKKLIKILVIGVMLSMVPINVYADSLDNINIGVDSNSYDVDRYWYPGKSQDISVYIENNDKKAVKVEAIYMELKSCKELETNETLNINSKQVDELLENSTVKLVYKEEVLFEDKLKKLVNERKIALPKKIDIKPEEKELLSIVIDMNKEMSNDAQSIQAIFNMGAKYKIETDIKDSNNKDDDSSIDGLPKTGIEFNIFNLLGLGAVGVGINLMRSKK